jgi:transcriptional regulator
MVPLAQAPAAILATAEPQLPLDILQEAGDVLVDILGEGGMGKQIDLLQGTLDLLVLRVLALQPMHGWGIAQRIRQVSNDVLQVQQGSLYPALHRLEEQGWIEAEWGESENKRRAKYYRLSRAGRSQLKAETASWERLSAAVALILQTS